MNDYTQVDAEILRLVQEKCNTSSGLTLRMELLVGSFPGPAFRVIDRRLQALRKAKKICFVKGKWEIQNEVLLKV